VSSSPNPRMESTKAIACMVTPPCLNIGDHGLIKIKPTTGHKQTLCHLVRLVAVTAETTGPSGGREGSGEANLRWRRGSPHNPRHHTGGDQCCAAPPINESSTSALSGRVSRGLCQLFAATTGEPRSQRSVSLYRPLLLQIKSHLQSLSLEEMIMQESTTGTIETESRSGADSAAESGMGVLTAVEEGMGTVGRATWEFFHHLPGHGVIAGGAVGLGAAMLVGVGELAVACFSGYVSYRVFAYGESLSEAIEKAIKFESGNLEKEEIEKPIPD